ncbi:MAG TPA: hypothetical protein VHQ02_11340 [Usitatibacter sp.]|jgi:hypothetical protein|nr:hypothetical protein [Usitatibacter sp.]
MLKAFAGAVAASAAMAAPAAIPPAYLAHLPPAQQSAGGVEYLTGGRTPEEAAAVKRAAQEYPLELVFMEQDGKRKDELYDNPVVIRDASGKVVLASRTDGPYFLARLPAGDYTVTTHWDSWSFTKPVTIGPDERERVVFEWKKPAAGAGEVANG